MPFLLTFPRSTGVFQPPSQNVTTFDFSATVPGGASVARSGTATYINTSGLVLSVGSNQGRIDCEASLDTGAPPPPPPPPAPPPPPPAGVRTPNLQPFNTTSVWNTPIGTGVVWSLPSDADTRAINQANGAVNAGNFSSPFFYGKASDPIRTVTCTDNLQVVPVQSIHVPVGAAPSPDSDHHMNFFDATQPTKMWSYNGCVASTGGWTCNLGQVDNICGTGVDVDQGTFGYNFGIGTMMLWELNAGVIRHSLRYSVSVDIAASPSSQPGTWDQGIPWPNTHEDYNGPVTYTGDLIAGSTIGIPHGVTLPALSAGGAMLVKALQDYGAIMRDTGGTNAVIFYAEQSAEGIPAIAQMRADMPLIVPLLRVMRNQGPNSINGGGTPVASGPPSLDPAVCPVG
jgi:hypothetical protein